MGEKIVSLVALCLVVGLLISWIAVAVYNRGLVTIMPSGGGEFVLYSDAKRLVTTLSNEILGALFSGVLAGVVSALAVRDLLKR